MGRKEGQRENRFWVVGRIIRKSDRSGETDGPGWMEGTKKKDDELLLMSTRRNDYHFSGRSPSLQSASGMDGRRTEAKKIIKTKD